MVFKSWGTYSGKHGKYILLFMFPQGPLVMCSNVVLQGREQ